VALLATLRAGSPLFDALARSDAKTLGGWLIVAILVLLRLRRSAAGAVTALLIWMAYLTSDVLNWAWLDQPAVSDTIMITACGATLAGMVLASALSKRVATSWPCPPTT
jgi:hypothetical protein